MNKLKRARHIRVRKNIAGTTERPRLAVFRSGKHIYAQVIDDSVSKTLVSASDLKIKKGVPQEMAFEVGKQVAEKATKKGINKVVFDRGGFIYHGRIRRLAEGAREGGLEF